MSKHHIRILKAASQDLERLDKPTGRRIAHRIHWLAVNLEAIRLEALTGDLAGLYKLRVGDYRVIYEVLWGLVGMRQFIPAADRWEEGHSIPAGTGRGCGGKATGEDAPRGSGAGNGAGRLSLIFRQGASPA